MAVCVHIGGHQDQEGDSQPLEIRDVIKLSGKDFYHSSIRAWTADGKKFNAVFSFFVLIYRLALTH